MKLGLVAQSLQMNLVKMRSLGWVTPYKIGILYRYSHIGPKAQKKVKIKIMRRRELCVALNIKYVLC